MELNLKEKKELIVEIRLLLEHVAAQEVSLVDIMDGISHDKCSNIRRWLEDIEAENHP